MNKNSTDFYQEKETKASRELENLKRRILINSLGRLATFVFTFICLFGMLKASLLFALVSAGLLFFSFLLLVRRHITLQSKRNYLRQVKEISRGELDASCYKFKNFEDGKEYQDTRHDYSYDLDLFGANSVFQMLNRTVTKEGERILAGNLTSDFLNPKEIEQRQDSIRELSQMPEFLVHYRATGAVSGLVDEDRKDVQQWVSEKSLVHNNIFLRVMTYLCPAIFMVSLILTILNGNNAPLLIFVFIVNLGIVAFNFRKTNKEHSRVSKLFRMLRKYQELLFVIESCDFKAKQLSESKAKLGINGQTSGQVLQKLTKIVSALDNRLNFAVSVFLEGTLLWDYLCLFRLDKWKSRYGSKLHLWLEQVSLFDSFVSMASYAFLNNDYQYPKVTETGVIKAESLSHPLIPSSVRVSNDFTIDNQGNFVIITGANMAGKSTFLRTVGVNIILAKAGLPVCASSFEFTPAKLFTSMRTSDSLSSNESYFYAELLRLKFLMEKLKRGETLFIILDEILKGTNSLDKQKGSKLALEKIIRLGGTGIIATHDLSLTDMENSFPDKIKNQCFEVEIDNADISFDYKLYDGVTRKMNAMLLMKQMEIV